MTVWMWGANDQGQCGDIWSSATGEYFSIECTTNLANGFTGALLSSILATPPLNTITVPATSGSYCYRLKF